MIKLLSINRNKAAETIKNTNIVSSAFYAPLGLERKDTVQLGNIVKDKLKNVFSYYGRKIENINDCFDVKKAINGFDYFRFKSGTAEKPHNFEFFGKKQKLFKFLKNNNIEYSVHKKEHGNELIQYFFNDKGHVRYCYLSEYSHKNNRLIRGYGSVSDESVVLRKSNAGYELKYNDNHTLGDGSLRSEHTTLVFNKAMKVKESLTELDKYSASASEDAKKVIRIKYDENGFPLS